MATKTFEELKQLAIQIRDEKTNKQNTATRIGTQMLEHLNKLEQDYYDKTATDEELKQRDEKLTELSSNIGDVRLSTIEKDVQLFVNGDQNRYEHILGLSIGKIYKVSVKANRVIDDGYINVYAYKDKSLSISNDASLIGRLTNADNAVFYYTPTTDYQYLGIYSTLNDGTSVDISISDINTLMLKEVGNVIDIGDSFTDDMYLDFVDNQVVEKESSSLCVSDYIDVRNYSIIMFPFLASASGCIYYNENKIAIGKFHTDEKTDYIDKVVMIPNGVSFIKWNIKKIYKKTKRIYAANQGLLSFLRENIIRQNNNVGEVKNLLGVNITENKYINYNNRVLTENSLNGSGYTDYIDIHDYNIILLPFAYSIVCVFFDINYNPISRGYIGSDSEYQIVENDYPHVVRLYVLDLKSVL